MPIRIFLLALCLFFNSFSELIAQRTEPDFYSTQEEKPKREKQPLKERVVLGGNLGLAFGTNTFLQVAPQVGYRLTPNFMAGVGGGYTYYKYGNFGAESLYSISGWSRLNVFEGIFLCTELESVNCTVYDRYNRATRENVPLWLVGLGYASGSGDGLGVSMQLMFDLIGDTRSPYANPLIRGGVLFAI
jgi:hypothetical protein